MKSRLSRTAILLLSVFLLYACGGQSQTAPPVDDAPTQPTSVPENTDIESSNPVLSALAPDGISRENYYAPFPVTISLDGELDDWDGVPRVLLPENANEIEGTTSVQFAVTADDVYLYVLGDVTDSVIISGQHGADYWNEDSFEIYLNATGDLRLASYREGVAQVTVPPLNIGKSGDEIVLGGMRGASANADVIVVETETGYAVEMAIPLETDVWSIEPFHGNVLGFQVHLNGATESSRNSKAIWSKFDVADSSYQNPGVFGELIFYEVGQTEAAYFAPEPELIELIEVPDNPIYKQADAPIADRVEDLMSYMTLAEKIGQMTLVEKGSIRVDDITNMFIGGLLSGGGGSPESNTTEAWAEMVDGYQQYALDSHLGIPLIYGVDAVHGHANLYGSVVFPHNIGLGAANNPELMERIGQVTAKEMIATGIYWNYGPAVSVPMDVRWGRTYEGYSEEPERVSLLAAAYLRGMQGDDLAALDTVVGTPKHFVGDGGAVWGTSTTGSYQIDQGVTDIDEETLRAIHLPPYYDVLEAGARTIMVSYTSWGGIKMHGQAYLINDVLKDEMGFDGFIVSDWGAIDQITGNYYKDVVTAINAGIDMNMVPYDYVRFIETMNDAIEEGDISIERVDDAVRRILTVKFEMGLFENPVSNPDFVAEVGSEAHRAVAREAVAQSLVLLKNDNGLLPLSKDVETLFIGGSAADDIGIQSGGWTIEWQGKAGDITPGTTILQGIQAAVGTNTLIEYQKAGLFEGNPADENAVCLAIVGEPPYAEGMGDSRNLALPTGDLRALRNMEEACTNLAVVLISGRPVIITNFVDKWDALVAAWLPGTEGGGVADVLFGDQPFVGTLPMTWPRLVDQLPLNIHNSTGEGCEGPLFPYNYGITQENPNPAPLAVCEE